MEKRFILPMKLNSGAKRHHHLMFNLGRSMLDVQTEKRWD
jgi:hypothetical protein